MENLFGALRRWGCGLTFETFHVGKKEPLVQWIAARPLDALDSNSDADSAGLLSQAEDKGFIAVKRDNEWPAGLDTQVGTSDSCPFNPLRCAGQHRVVTAVGIFAKR